MNIVRWDERHGRILGDICSRLARNEIRYFILRNYEGLPNTNPSKDVDIVVDPIHFIKAKEILVDVYRHYRVPNYYEARHGYLHCCHGMDLANNFAIHIDLISSYVSKGSELFSFDELYKNTEDYNDFRVLNRYFEGVMVFIYKQFNYSPQLKDEYKEIIYSTHKSYPEFGQLLTELVGSELALKIMATIDNRRFDEMLMLSSKLTKALKRHAFARRPLRTSYLTAEFYVVKASKILFSYRRFEKSFAVIEPNGSGKTTFLNDLLEKIDFYFVNDKSDGRCHVYQFRPSVLPNLGFLGEIKERDRDFSNPRSAKPAGKFSSFMRVSYYWLDYVLGYNFYVRKDVQYDRFSVFDGYGYDLIIDRVRTKLNLPFWIRKLFVRLMPHPKVVFYLDDDVVIDRKQEIQPDEITRQNTDYRALAASHNRFIPLDANRPADESTNEALQIILDTYTTRL